MPSITDKFGRASLPTDTAIATTVKTTRAPGVLVIECFDLSKYSVDTPVYFVTYKKTTDPVTGIVSITNLVSYKALVNIGANTLTNLTVAPGYTDLGNDVGDFVECIPTSYWESQFLDGIFVGHNPDGTFKKAPLKTALGDDANLIQVMDEGFSDFVQSGGIWAALAGLNAGMSALAGYIDGYRNTVAAVATRAFTLSKDTYVDVLRNTGTNAFSLVYTEVANGAAAPALAANSLRLAKVVTSGVAVTSVVQSGTDSLGNYVYNTKAVTSYRLYNPVKFKVYLSANIAATTSDIPFNVREFDTGSNVDITTNKGRFTAPVSGYYNLTATIGQNGVGASGINAIFFVNGNAKLTGFQNVSSASGTGNVYESVSGLIYLAAGDYVTVRSNYTSLAVSGTITASNFMGFLVSEL